MLGLLLGSSWLSFWVGCGVFWVGHGGLETADVGNWGGQSQVVGSMVVGKSSKSLGHTETYFIPRFWVEYGLLMVTMSIDPLGDSNTFKPPWLWLIANSSNTINYRVVCDVENCCFPMFSYHFAVSNVKAWKHNGFAQQIVAQILVIGAGPELAPITGTSGCAQWLSQRAWVSCLAMEWWVLSICQKASRCLSGKGLHVSCSLVPACAGFCAGWLLEGVCEFILVHMYIYNCIDINLNYFHICMIIDVECIIMYHRVCSPLPCADTCRYTFLFHAEICRLIGLPPTSAADPHGPGSWAEITNESIAQNTWISLTWARGMDFVYHIMFVIPHIVLIIVYVW